MQLEYNNNPVQHFLLIYNSKLNKVNALLKISNFQIALNR